MQNGEVSEEAAGEGKVQAMNDEAETKLDEIDRQGQVGRFFVALLAEMTAGGDMVDVDRVNRLAEALVDRGFRWTGEDPTVWQTLVPGRTNEVRLHMNFGRASTALSYAVQVYRTRWGAKRDGRPLELWRLAGGRWRKVWEGDPGEVDEHDTPWRAAL